jgi:hypothetical protein
VAAIRLSTVLRLVAAFRRPHSSATRAVDRQDAVGETGAQFGEPAREDVRLGGIAGTQPLNANADLAERHDAHM